MMGVFRNKLAVLCVFLLAFTLFESCENPFDPLSTSDEIRGLAYIDFSVTWERWDSDTEYDGVELTPEYFNEFGDTLSFSDKSHKITLSFYQEAFVNCSYAEDAVDPQPNASDCDISFGAHIFSYSTTYKRSDDIVRVPIESYKSKLTAAGYDLSETVKVFTIFKVFPPKNKPKEQLLAYYDGTTVFQPTDTGATDEEVEAL